MGVEWGWNRDLPRHLRPSQRSPSPANPSLHFNAEDPPARPHPRAEPRPGPGKSAIAFGYNDFDREKAQQSVINGIKGRLTDPLRLPYNFIKGPIIGWVAPKAFVSDMGLAKK